MTKKEKKKWEIHNVALPEKVNLHVNVHKKQNSLKSNKKVGFKNRTLIM